MINVADIVKDTDFTQIVTHIVRKASVDNYGRNVPVLTRTKIKAVVTTPKDSDLIRLPEGTQHNKYKLFTSTTRFNPDSIPGLPDIIEYKGNHFIVLSVDDYSEYGYSRALGGMLETAVAKQYKE